MASFRPVDRQNKLLSPEERKILIRNLKNKIEQLEHWYLDTGSRKVGDILVFDTNNDHSSPKIMTPKERETTFNEKRTKIQQQLKSLKWKHRFCTECEKYKIKEEFQTRDSICKDCYSATLRAKREEILERREISRSNENKNRFIKLGKI